MTWLQKFLQTLLALAVGGASVAPAEMVRYAAPGPFAEVATRPGGRVTRAARARGRQAPPPPCQAFINITQTPGPNIEQSTAEVHVEYGEIITPDCLSMGGADPFTFQFTVNGVDRTSAFTAPDGLDTATALPLATGSGPTVNTLIASVDGYLANGTPGTVRDTVQITVYPGVNVTALSGATAFEEQDQGTFRFEVHNRSYGQRSFTLTCTPTRATCDNLSPGSPLTLGAGVRDTVTVTATMATGADQGSIRLIASGYSADTASTTFTVSAVTRLSVFAPVLDQQVRAVCPTVGAGAGSAVQCGHLLYAHSFPAYQSMGKSRALTMLYNSDLAHPVPAVTLDFTTLGGESIPEQYAVEIRDLVTDTLLRRAHYGSGTVPAAYRQTQRMVVALDHPLVKQTGAHRVRAQVFGRYGGTWSTTPIATAETRLLVVDRSASRFGAGWWPAGIERLHPAVDSSGVLLELPEGSAVFYRKVGTQYVSAPGDYSVLERLSDGTYRRTLEGAQVTLAYDAQGFLTRIADNNAPQQNEATYIWRQDTLRVQDAGGAVMTFAYDAAGVKIAYPGVDSVRLLRNGSGDVSEIRDADHFVNRFEYASPTHRMTKSHVRGTGAFGYTYDALGLVDSVKTWLTSWSPSQRRFVPWQRNGAAMPGGATEASPAAFGYGLPMLKIVQESWPDGTQAKTDTTRVTVHRTGAVLSMQGPVSSTTVERDTLGRPTEVVLPNGGKVRQEYDAHGLLARTIMRIHPGEIGRDSTFRYDTTHYQWDTTRRVIERIENPMRDTTRFTYDALRRRSTVIDNAGAVTTFHYNARGQLDTIWAPHPTTLGAKEPVPTVYVYDPVTGNPRSAGKGANVVTYGYPAGRPYEPNRMTDALGSVTEYEFDAQKRVTKVRQYGTLGGARDVRYEFDDTLFVTRQVDPNGWRSTWTRDRVGRVVAFCVRDNVCDSTRYGDLVNPTVQKDRSGRVVWNTFDGGGRLTQKQLGPLDTLPVLYQYDALGNIIRAKNEHSDVWRLFDEFGRLRSESQEINLLPDTLIVIDSATGTADTVPRHARQEVKVYYEYDPNGRRRAMYVRGVGLGIIEKSPMPPFALPDDEAAERGPHERFIPADSVRYRYDPASNLDSIVNTMWQLTRGQGNHIWAYSHDRKGRMTGVTVPKAGGTTAITFGYDTLDNRRGTYGMPGVSMDSVNVDVLGRTTKRHYIGPANWTTYTFDALGQLKVMDSSDDTYMDPEAYTYDSTGNRLTKGTVWGYRYDQLGRLEKQFKQGHEDEPGSCAVEYTYDARGNRTQEEWVEGYCGGGPRRSKYFYNGWNQMDSMYVEVDQGGSISRSFWYDALGRRIFMRSTDATVHTGNQIEEGVWRYYWADDHVIAQTKSGILAGDENLHAEVELRRQGDGLWSFGQWFWYGPGIDRPLATYHKAGGAWQSRYLFFPDVRGSVAAVTDTTGTPVAEPALYSAFGTSNTVSPGQPGYNGAQSAGGLVYMRNRWYDPNTGQFTQQDPIGFAGGINLYAYAGNDPVTYSDPYGLNPDIEIEIPRSWKEFKEQVKDVVKHIRRNWHRIGLPEDPTAPRQPKPDDMLNPPPPAEERPATNPAPGDGRPRLPGPDGQPGPEIRYEFRIPNILDWLTTPRQWPEWMPTEPARPQPWMMPPIPGFGTPLFPIVL